MSKTIQVKVEWSKLSNRDKIDNLHFRVESIERMLTEMLTQMIAADKIDKEQKEQLPND